MFTQTDLLVLIGTVGIITTIAVEALTRKKLKAIWSKPIHVDFGLASKEEVIEKFGQEVGTIIIEERRIVFYKFAWFWAVGGAFLGIIVYNIVR